MSGGFDLNTLSASLDPQERQRLLDAIRAVSETDGAPVVAEAEPQLEAIEEQYRKLGFFDRVRLLLTQLFSGRSRIEVLTRWATQSLAARVQQRAGDGLDAKRRVFLDPFAESIARLATALARVTNYLQVAANQRVDLVLRLVEAVAPSVHRELIDATSATQIMRLDTASERELRKRLSAHMEQCMAEFGTGERQRVRQALIQADILRRLCDFGLSSILASFNGNATDRSRECAFDYVARPIERLAVEFAGLHQTIDPLLIETLVLLKEEPQDGINGQLATAPPEGFEDAHDYPSTPEELRDAVTGGIQKIQTVIATLRRIGKRYPMLSIARLIHNDPWWMPEAMAPTDDWRVLYRGAFSERIQRHVLMVSLRRQISDQLRALADVGDTRPVPVPGLHKPGIRGFLRAMALYLFVNRLYDPSLALLRLILTDGEFYKNSNRAQYNDTFGELERLPGMVTQLIKNLAPGSAWAQALTGAGGEQARMEVVMRVHEDIDAMTEHAKTTLEMLVNLLGGILYAAAGSTYDTLANLGQIGGRRNAEFMDDARLVHTRMERFVGILNELIRIERRAEEHSIELSPAILSELS